MKIEWMESGGGPPGGYIEAVAKDPHTYLVARIDTATFECVLDPWDQGWSGDHTTVTQHASLEEAKRYAETTVRMVRASTKDPRT